jgi:Asp-tRNA(Asn)/Glu-tRNA(Gln) amidotransferase A subunit family amidase
MSDLHWLSVTQVAQQIRRKQMSPVDLTQALLERIATYDSRYNASIGLMAERSMTQARRASDYVQAMRWRARLTARMNDALAAVDVAITASSMDPPYPIDDPVEMERCYPRQARSPFNLTGHPALALPTGFTTKGLPLGMQIVGKHWDETTIYRVAYAHAKLER